MLNLDAYPMNFRAYATRGIIWGQRKLFCHWLGGLTDHSLMPIHYQGVDAANEAIYRLLCEDCPSFVTRFGCVELDAILRGYDIRSKGNALKKSLLMLTGSSGPFWWDNSIRRNMLRTTGVFPADDSTLVRFSDMSLEDCRQIDILGTWNARERMLWRRYFPEAEGVGLSHLEPWFSACPWTRWLAGKKVLVINSFASTIKSQYERRQELFANRDILPDFSLITYQSVMSYLGLETPYKDWFEALEKMKADIAKFDFDIAILGCGAYGMSLGAFIKRDMHRRAVCLGGVTQLLFGIKGGRFDARPRYAAMYNEAWTRASGAERPDNFRAHEGGAYW